MEIAVRHSLFESAIGINFDTENSILNIGINVIPLVTFILLKRIRENIANQNIISQLDDNVKN